MSMQLKSKRDIWAKRARTWVFAAVCGAWAAGAHCAVRVDLFQATVPLVERTEAGQTAAFQAAMRGVLVRVTGRRGGDQDPGLAPLVTDARRYVQQFRGAPDNQLWVAFDAAAIERWLSQNGQPLWGRDRPSTFVWLAISSGAGTGYVATRDDQSELKNSLDALAAERGIPLIWPGTADLQANHVDYGAINNLSATTLADIARHLGADAVLIGRAGAPLAAANVRWVHVFQDPPQVPLGQFPRQEEDVFRHAYRAARAAFAPQRARTCAKRTPNPDDAPVIRATWPERSSEKFGVGNSSFISTTSVRCATFPRCPWR